MGRNCLKKKVNLDAILLLSEKIMPESNTEKCWENYARKQHWEMLKNFIINVSARICIAHGYKLINVLSMLALCEQEHL